MRPWFLPCHAVNRSLMRCRPSSRSFAEKRRRHALGQAFGRHGPGHVLAVANGFGEDPAQPGPRQRRGVAADAAGVLDQRGGARANGFERADGGHQRALFALQQAGGLHGQPRRVGEAEVFVEAAAERLREVRVAVDQAGEQRLAAAVVDLGVGIRLEHLVGRADRGDRVAGHRQRDVVPNGIDGDDRGVGKDHGVAGCGLCLCAGGLQEQRGGAGAGSRQQIASRQVSGDCHGALYSEATPSLRSSRPLRESRKSFRNLYLSRSISSTLEGQDTSKTAPLSPRRVVHLIYASIHFSPLPVGQVHVTSPPFHRLVVVAKGGRYARDSYHHGVDPISAVVRFRVGAKHRRGHRCREGLHRRSPSGC